MILQKKFTTPEWMTPLSDNDRCTAMCPQEYSTCPGERCDLHKNHDRLEQHKVSRIGYTDPENESVCCGVSWISKEDEPLFLRHWGMKRACPSGGR